MSPAERPRRRPTTGVQTLSLFAWAKAQAPPEQTAILAPQAAFGLAQLDAALGGSLRRGSLTLLAARSGEGATALAMAALLHTLQGGGVTTVFSSRLRPALVRQRLLVLAAKVNFFRGAAHLLGAAQQQALAAADRQMAWQRLHMLRGSRLRREVLHEHLCVNACALCVVDVPISTLCPEAEAPQRRLQRLAELARQHQVALLLRHRLRRRPRLDEPADWPFDAASRACFSSMLWLERARDVAGSGRGAEQTAACNASVDARTAVVRVLRQEARDVPPDESRCVRLAFDQRYFGYSDL